MRRGALDRSFQDGLPGAGNLSLFNSNVDSVALQNDGKVVIGGGFSSVNGVPAAGMARLWSSADIPPRIHSLKRSGADANLISDALPNRIYRVQYKQIVSASNWTDLAGDIFAVSGTATKTDSTFGRRQPAVLSRTAVPVNQMTQRERPPPVDPLNRR